MSFERYNRQVLLPFIGEEGQRKISASTAVVAGCGALGTVIANVLAREGLTEDVKRWRRLMTAGVLQSFENFDRLGLVSHTPEVGSVWLARHGSTRNGHCGIVTHCEPKRMLIGTIEANTSLDSLDPAKDREGDWITTRLSAMRGRGELKTLGFISPRAMLPL